SARPAHHAGRAWVGTHTRTRGTPPRRSRSAPRRLPFVRSCLPGRLPRAGAGDHLPSVYTDVAMVAPGTLLDEPLHVGPRSCDRGLLRSPARSVRPRRAPLLA